MMIKALLIESDPRLGDIIEVGLDTFQAFEVDRAKDSSATTMMRDKPYDLIIANFDLGGKGDGVAVIRQIREDNQEVEIIAVASGKSSRSHAKEKAAANLFAVLPLPLDERHFYKTLARARDRIEAKQATQKDSEPDAEE
jgi:DNA-binding response OmpR family regulator